MTRMTNARIAGFAFLFYIAASLPYSSAGRVGLVLGLFSCFAALVLAVTLYAITRDQDRDVAMLALTFRVAEGVLGASTIPARLALLPLGTTTGNAAGDQAAQTLNTFLASARGWNTILAATFFAVGSLLFAWLMLRGRMIPAALAWLGLLASAVLVVGLPLQLGGILYDPFTQIMWLPMAAFEIPLGLWLLVKGVALPVRTGAPLDLADATLTGSNS